MIKDRKKIQSQSNIKTLKLEVPRYRLQCHSLVELNGFDKFEVHGQVFFTKLSPVTLRKDTFSHG